jgi:hypothetical protein
MKEDIRKKKTENLRLVRPVMPHLASLINLRDSGKTPRPHLLLHRLSLLWILWSLPDAQDGLDPFHTQFMLFRSA